ncbi:MULTISPECIES: FliM/FliN family flagellar motor switch protein [unclassified Paracoccus (in: a-proteobacteria)]|uniref:FliM/FliN family flagellar motor switch protein n=1 Tax=unclassified Paracoccus (in: a-proteobacteria) TaxID=2688777 RepID=UPI0012B244E4|nr:MULTISPECIES: FliM/FliN family flagellar motor C-terminal domain-containing protein [unclassified Paracoccus (in: a-proteobacteria)]UXU75880.1 FliM/FliN family flagellar motor switch protein [Paracoccus sp. SMMA_5]UXU81790.1 FliM/FliN family flagellar motor switch protein [Paracoccus sp. SMMA_5_TC]
MDDLASLIATDQIQVEITISLGSTRLSVAELSRLRPDDVLTLDQQISDGVEICVGDKVIARGELVAGEDDDQRLCVRILGPAGAT